MSIHSNELNFLIFRYLQESGFVHSAFTFGVECQIQDFNVNGASIPPGALINIVQKGLLYAEAEVSLTEDGTSLATKEPLSLLESVCPEVLASRMSACHNAVANATTSSTSTDGGLTTKSSDVSVKHESAAEAVTNMDVTVEDIPVSRPPVVNTTTAPTPVTPSASTECKPTVLRGHQSEVFICAWSPKADMIASGAGDATARIWTLENSSISSVVLPHTDSVRNGDNGHSKDVTSLDWNHEGTLLATGSYDGHARTWTADGQLRHVLTGHEGPIFAIKWNRKGSHILTGGVDKSAVVWDAQSGQVKQQFKFHSAPCLDLDWQGNQTFATCSQDKLIHVCRVGLDRPVRTFQGHTNEVNTLRWDPSGALLASCSDDCTAKIWSLKQEKWVHNFHEHSKEIYTIRFSRTGPFTNYPNARLQFATASFDATVRLWDIDTGRCLHTLSGHREAVYSVAFSPDASLLASGSFDNCLHIWSTKDASLVHTYQGTSGAFEVCFNRDGTKVAASFADNTVVVLDVRKLQGRHE